MDELESDIIGDCPECGEEGVELTEDGICYDCYTELLEEDPEDEDEELD